MDEQPLNPERPAPADPQDELGDESDGLTSELVAYLDGELDRQGNEVVGAKISLDAAVRAEADALKRTWELLDHLPRPEPSPNFTERTISRIEPIVPIGSGSGPAAVKSGPASAMPRSSTSSAPVVQVSVRRSRRYRLAMGATWLILIGAAGLSGYFIRGEVVRQFDRIDQQEKDAQILSERRLLQNLQTYRYIDDLTFLKDLDDPDLFGEEQTLPMPEESK